jgi:hypothetical protein
VPIRRTDFATGRAPRFIRRTGFRYNERMARNVTDAERATKAIAGMVGKRVTYLPI